MRSAQAKHKFGIMTTAIISLSFALSTSFAQEVSPSAISKAAQRKSTKQTFSQEEKKLQSHLYETFKRMESAGISRANAAQQNVKARFSTPLIEADDQGRLLVTLRTSEITPQLHAQLKNLGFEVVASTDNLKITRNHQMITGWISFDRILEVARLASVFHVRPADKPVVLTGSVNGAGDAVLRADQARSNLGIDGTGQMVGIISDGVSHLTDSQASGDLPGTVSVINNRFGGDEGTAMLEIVHDLAPGADLAFADFGSGQADFANNIDLLRQAGCTVISDDIIYLLEPVYEDGIIAQMVDDVVNNHNVVYTSSAGNQHLDHYEGDFVSIDADGIHEFGPGDESINVNLASGALIRVVLQWNNQFGKASDDYDLYLFDATLSTILSASVDVQDGTGDPAEILAYVNPNPFTITVNIVVNKFAGAARNLSIYTFGGGVTPTQYAGTGGAIYGHSAAQSCLAVGAIAASDPGNDDIESFSSRGPVRIYSYDAMGNPTGFVDRNKPEHAAIDGVETKTGQLGWFSNPFFGTSAATPHTAGVAALLREVDVTLTAIETGQVLDNTAVDLGAAGFDPIFGNGRIDALRAVTRPTDWIARYDAAAKGADEANALALDSAGNAHVTGFSLGTTTNHDFATVKYNTGGVRQWISRFNGPANNVDEAKDIAVDASGNVIAAGLSYNANGNQDFFAVKYNSNGAKQWAARYNGSGNGDDKINALAVDGAGNIFVTGPSMGGSGSVDCITIMYNSAGARQWARRYNAPPNNHDEGTDIVVDGSSNVYVTGYSHGAKGNHDYFVIKYNSAGVRQWVKRYNGPGNGDDIANKMTIDASGNIYITGHSVGTSGSPDFATIKYNNAGVQQWVARYNSPANSADEARGIGVDAAGNVYVTGNSPAVIGNQDYFTVKYNSAGAQQWSARYNGPGDGEDVANALSIDGDGNVYVIGHSLGSSGSQDYATLMYNNAGVRQWFARYNAKANDRDEARDIAVDAGGNVYVGGYSIAANGQADYVTIKYPASSANAANALMAEIEDENLSEIVEHEQPGIDSQNAAPTRFTLSQNYPNPFNPTTLIGFALPEAGEVTLTIYNTAGQLVKQYAGSFSSGRHELLWDGRNATGEKVAAGVYLYRLIVHDAAGAVVFNETRRMALLK